MAVEDDLGGQGEDPTHIMSPYEQSRERRIRENLERMRKMGILHITQKLRASSAGIRKRGRPTSSAVAARRKNEDGTGAGGSLRRLNPLRRSSRLQKSTLVTYSDVMLSGRVSGQTKSEKAISAAADKQTLLEEGPKPEAYTKDHEKRLGSTEKSWELFVDGYGNDGRRVYDPFKGKSCHQCRQKTLGHRTECSQCGMVQGQFCGDCLYMRYGEHVLEALENPKWICPVCRGICNCSLCRRAKGWAPTGPLYRKISSMGFKSVAHYLIQTRCLQLKLETQTHSDPPAHLSAKRSLPFSNNLDCKEPPEKNMEIKNFHIDSMKERNSSLTTDRVPAGHLSIKRSLSFISNDNNTVAEEEALDHQIDTEEHSEDQRIVVANGSVSKDSGQAKKRGFCSELNQDSIIERLRLRKNSLCLFSDDNNAETEQAPDNQRGNKEQKEGHHIVVAAISMAANSLKQLSKHGACREPNQDSIGGRLRLKKKSLCLLSDGNNAKNEQVLDYQRGKEEQNEGHRIVMTTISEAANIFVQVKKHGSCSKPNQNDIGGGLYSTNKSFCLLSDDSHDKMDQPPDNQRGNEEQNVAHRIVVAGICVTANRSKPVKKYASCSKPNQDSIGGRLRSRKKSLCLLSDGNNAETKQSLDYQRGNEEPNENHCIVLAAISAYANSLKQVKKISSCSEPNQDSVGGRLQPIKKTSCLLSDGNNAKTEQLQDYQRGNKEHNEDHRIVVAAISAAPNSFGQLKKHGSCCESNQDDIGGGLCLRKKSFCLLSDYNQAKMNWPPDCRRGNKEHNEDRRIVVAAISAATNSLTQVKKHGSCSKSNHDDIGGRLCLRKKSLCLLSDYNNAKLEWSPGYQRSNKEQNEDYRIVVAGISAAANSLRPVKGLEPCRELNQDSIGGRQRLRKRSSSVLFDGNGNAEAKKALDNWEGDEVKSLMKTGTL